MAHGRHATSSSLHDISPSALWLLPQFSRELQGSCCVVAFRFLEGVRGVWVQWLSWLNR
jgi:hypothetical protein